MKKRISKLGLAAFVALALSAGTGVSSASATELFGAESYVANLSGANTVVHKFPSAISCPTSTLAGTMWSSTTVLEMKPTYSECTLGILTIKVSMNGCVYRFSASGELEISCPASETPGITMTNLYLCPLRIPPQVIKGMAVYTTGTTEEGKSQINIMVGGGKTPPKLLYYWSNMNSNCTIQETHEEPYKGIWNVTGANGAGFPINVFAK